MTSFNLLLIGTSFILATISPIGGFILLGCGIAGLWLHKGENK